LRAWNAVSFIGAENEKIAQGGNMKKIIYTAAALLLACVASVSVAKAADTGIRIGFQPGTAPRFFVARNQMMFEKAGLAPEFLKFISGPPMLAALQGENIDVAFMTTAPAIFALSQAIDIRVFFIESDSASTQALISTKEAALTSLADQKGKKIAVTFGTSAHYGLLKSLEAEKIAEAAVTVLDMQPSAMVPAFIKGDIAGAWTWDPWTAKMQSEGGTIVGSLGSLRLPMAGVWVVRTEWLAKNEEAIQRFIKSMDMTTEYMKTHEADAVKAIAGELGVDDRSAHIIYGRIEVPPLDQQLEGYRAALGTVKTKETAGMATHMNDLAEFFYGLKRIPAKPDVVAAIDPQPLQKYLHKQ
jgi:ABC-type nitrate/sulfonate/bicarbonate transport system substrate-binding protein